MNKGYAQTVLDKGYVRYIDSFGTDERIVESARISYKSPSKGADQDKKLLLYLWKNQHTSPFEQCNITFNIKMPIFVMRQFVRHRTFRLNEMSGRYTEFIEEFYIPDNWRKQDTKNKQGSIEEEKFNPFIGVNGPDGDPIYATDAFQNHCYNSFKLYQEFLEKGISKEMSRMILPVNLYTEIYVNCDLNNLLRFFRLRLDEHAQWEIRQYAKAMYYVFANLYPMCAEAYEKYKTTVTDVTQEIP
jgi:thymidylate synthase (FAD)